MNAYGITDQGLQREINQDNILVCQNEIGGVALVADGMGGHSHGERASAAVRTAVQEWWDEYCGVLTNYPFNDMVMTMEETLRRANEDFYHQVAGRMTCGSTIVMMMWVGDAYACLHAGDSRIYTGYGDIVWKFGQITVDDVWENKKDLPEAIRNIPDHPDRGKLTNAFGTRENVGITISADTIKPGQVFLICSDGLYKMVSEKNISRYVKMVSRRDDVANIVETMRQEVYANGAVDNVSIIFVR